VSRADPILNERRLLAQLALEAAAEELAEREGITPLQAHRKLKARAHILSINKRMEDFTIRQREYPLITDFERINGGVML
jgi:hypothetical protein